ncbi:MAG: hypothetical protein D6715_00150 [Calditrichaeota bacterium]|nr:MAG: hypothetical protein D6715_00150 [Calditrichota bacterium]
MRRTGELIGITLVTILLGCGGGGNQQQAAKEQPAGEGSQQQTQMQATAPAGSASISGTVKFVGTPPRRRPLRLDRECAVLHEEKVYSQDAVVNEDGALKWVFVYIKEGISQNFPPPSEPVVFDQRGCMYDPHVFGIQVGQTLKILNSDPLLHNIHALPKLNRPFNFGMPNKGDVRERKFTKPEVMVRIKCDVHPWMSAYCGVLPHPYFSVTGDDGRFSIQNLPAGQYVVEAWHEKFGTQTATVTVGDGESKTVDFTFGQAASE